MRRPRFERATSRSIRSAAAERARTGADEIGIDLAVRQRNAAFGGAGQDPPKLTRRRARLLDRDDRRKVEPARREMPFETCSRCPWQPVNEPFERTGVSCTLSCVAIACSEVEGVEPALGVGEVEFFGIEARPWAYGALDATQERLSLRMVRVCDHSDEDGVLVCAATARERRASFAPGDPRWGRGRFYEGRPPTPRSPRASRLRRCARSTTAARRAAPGRCVRSFRR